MIEDMGAEWLGHEHWTLCAYRDHDPAVLAEEWTRDRVLRSYYYLRMRDLRDPPQ